MIDWAGRMALALQKARALNGDTGDIGDVVDNCLITNTNALVSDVPTSVPPTVAAGTVPRAVPGVPEVTPRPIHSIREKISTRDQYAPGRAPAVPGVPDDGKSRSNFILGRLRSMTPPESFRADAWRGLLADCGAFFDRWTGWIKLDDWSDLDLAGVHPIAPAARYDSMGLLLLIRGGTVMEMGSRRATIVTARNSRLVYRKHDSAIAVPLWELVRS